MPSLFNYFVTIFIIHMCLHSAWSLKCHQCNSKNPGEEDCFNVEDKVSKYLKDCRGPMNVSCRIQEQWVEFDVVTQHTDKRIIRQCASTPVDSDRTCYYRAGFGGKVNVCNCLGDGCNGAFRITSTLFVTIGTILFFKLLFI